MMAPGKLEAPDRYHLSSAIGWLELGNPEEARLELEKIRRPMRAHPDVLEARWQLHAKMSEWERCVRVARQATRIAPANPFGWIHLSFALHELKRTRDAYDNLIGVLVEFPYEWLMRYNLACYACQLGNLDEARRWLADAQVKGGVKQIKSMAEDDPDLAPLFTSQK